MREGWRYVLTPRARRDMRRLELPVRQRIFDALDRYVARLLGDVAKLRGSSDQWRLRVGDWRIRFRQDPDNRVIVVVRVLPRSQAYRE
jgi:mRNA interferase RelE/StbE